MIQIDSKVKIQNWYFDGHGADKTLKDLIGKVVSINGRLSYPVEIIFKEKIGSYFFTFSEIEEITQTSEEDKVDIDKIVELYNHDDFEEIAKAFSNQEIKWHENEWKEFIKKINEKKQEYTIHEIHEECGTSVSGKKLYWAKIRKND